MAGDGSISGCAEAASAGNLSGDLREFVDADLVAVGEHHRAEDRVLELPHIARPVIGGEQRHALRR